MPLVGSERGEKKDLLNQPPTEKKEHLTVMRQQWLTIVHTALFRGFEYTRARLI